MAWNRHAIAQMELRGRRRVDGVGRPQFDSTQPETARVTDGRRPPQESAQGVERRGLFGDERG